MAFCRHPHPAAELGTASGTDGRLHRLLPCAGQSAVGHCRPSEIPAHSLQGPDDPAVLQWPVSGVGCGRFAAGLLQPGDPLQQDPALPAEHGLQGAGRRPRCGHGGPDRRFPHRQHRRRCRTGRPDHFTGCAGKRQQSVQRHRYPAGQTLFGGRLDHRRRCGGRSHRHQLPLHPHPLAG